MGDEVIRGPPLGEVAGAGETLWVSTTRRDSLRRGASVAPRIEEGNMTVPRILFASSLPGRRSGPQPHWIDPATRCRSQAPRSATFEIESPNGYARTVVGTIEYLGDEARTYMVRSRIGELVRVPLRDIKREHGHLPEMRT
jgi:hypothetical protein